TPPPLFADVDWQNFTLVLPSSTSGTDCPSGPIQVTGGVYNGDEAFVRIMALAGSSSGGFAYGDLTGDGQPEAVMNAECLDMSPGGTLASLFVVARQGNQLSVVDVVADSPEDHQARGFGIVDGSLQVAGWPGGFNRLTPAARTTYRWDGTRM